MDEEKSQPQIGPSFRADSIAKVSMHARVYRAHPKPDNMTDEQYQALVSSQDEVVGHWDDLGSVDLDPNTLMPKVVL